MGPVSAARESVRTNRVDIDLFSAFDVPILAGRGLVAADTRENATAIVVNESFARRIAGGASVLGRRVRWTPRDGEPRHEMEVVGVVPDFDSGFTIPNSFDDPAPRVFQAMEPGAIQPVVLVLRVRRGSAADFAARLRDITAAVDPTLQLERLETVAGAWERIQQSFRLMALGIVGVIGSVLLLSAAGIYAMMSFTVARRRREIGIRSALGADPRRVLCGIFARASAQLAAGVLAGLVVDIAIDRIVPIMDGKGPVLIPAVSLLMVGVGMLAALGPARRGLGIQPTEALRPE